MVKNILKSKFTARSRKGFHIVSQTVWISRIAISPEQNLKLDTALDGQQITDQSEAADSCQTEQYLHFFKMRQSVFSCT